jgi:hypothetical protein
MRYRDRLDTQQLRQYASALNSRARALGRDGVVDADTLRGVILSCGGRCEWCGGRLIEAEFELDHVYSLRAGGLNTPDNLVVACMACNRAKGDRHPARFAREKRAQGSSTALVMRLLDAHQADDAGVQLNLFEDAPPPRGLHLLDDPPPDDDAPDIPPYRW